eukprot:355612-Chlamydomonas_euryale.AAC.3
MQRLASDAFLRALHPKPCSLCPPLISAIFHLVVTHASAYALQHTHLATHAACRKLAYVPRGHFSCRTLFLAWQVRGKLYELLANCVPAELIIKTLLFELLKKLDEELKVEAVHWAAFYEHRLQEGQKAIFHLEAFVAKFMSVYKTWTISMME